MPVELDADANLELNRVAVDEPQPEQQEQRQPQPEQQEPHQPPQELLPEQARLLLEQQAPPALAAREPQQPPNQVGPNQAAQAADADPYAAIGPAENRAFAQDGHYTQEIETPILHTITAIAEALQTLGAPIDHDEDRMPSRIPLAAMQTHVIFDESAFAATFGPDDRRQVDEVDTLASPTDSSGESDSTNDSAEAPNVTVIDRGEPTTPLLRRRSGRPPKLDPGTRPTDPSRLPDDLTSLRLGQLKNECATRGLLVSGNKATLAARLRARLAEPTRPRSTSTAD